MGLSDFNERSFSVSLYLAFFASMIPGMITGMLLIDISQTFNSSIGVVSQIRSVSAVLGVIAAISIGVLSVKIQSKQLILIGLGLMVIVGLGSGTASTLTILFIVYSLQGLGIGITSPMISAMIGEYLPPEKRSKAMGYLVAAGSISFLVSSPIISWLNNSQSWRSAFLSYQVPVMLFALIFAIIYLPSSKRTSQENSSYMEGVKLVRESKSAVACLLAVMLGAICWMSYLTFSTSFLREMFGISVSTASLVMVLTSGVFTVGSMLSGSVINRFGKRNVTAVGTLLLGVFTVLYTFSPSFLIGVVLSGVGFFFGGFRIPGANGMALEQVPEYRGVMMSLNTAFVNVGNVIGTVIGGYVLINYGWGMLGLVLGVFGVLASLIYWLFTEE
jgi:predicted MFS family arabinose efflux permease